MTLRLQDFYSDESVLRHLNHLFAQPTPGQIDDAIGELCNQTMGKMKELLSNQQIGTDLALPTFSSSWTEKLINATASAPDISYWALSTDDQILGFLVVHVKIHTAKLFENFNETWGRENSTDGNIGPFPVHSGTL